MRGLVFAAVLFPFRTVIVGPGGWWKLWGVLVGVGILSTYGPAPGSIEGMIDTTLPPPFHLYGAPEVVLQALAFAVLVVGWHRRPHPAWGWVLGIGTALTVLMSAAGVFLAPLAAGG